MASPAVQLGPRFGEFVGQVQLGAADHDSQRLTSERGVGLLSRNHHSIDGSRVLSCEVFVRPAIVPIAHWSLSATYSYVARSRSIDD